MPENQTQTKVNVDKPSMPVQLIRKCHNSQTGIAALIDHGSAITQRSIRTITLA